MYVCVCVYMYVCVCVCMLGSRMSWREEFVGWILPKYIVNIYKIIKE